MADKEEKEISEQETNDRLVAYFQLLLKVDMRLHPENYMTKNGN